MAALLGLVWGLVSAAPLCVSLHRPAPGMGAGMASVVASFALLHAGVLLVRLRAHGELVSFGALTALAFLAAVVAAVLRRELRR